MNLPLINEKNSFCSVGCHNTQNRYQYKHFANRVKNDCEVRYGISFGVNGKGQCGKKEIWIMKYLLDSLVI